MKSFFLGFVVLLFVGLGVTHRLVKSEGFTTFNQLPGLDTLAPGFTLPRLEGGTFDLAPQVVSDRPMVISFFTTWCEPCRIELAELFRLSTQVSSKSVPFTLVLIDVGEPAEKVRRFFQSLPPKPPSALVLLDESKTVATRYRVAAFPSLVVLDPWQRIRFSQIGLAQGTLYQVGSALRDAQTAWRVSRGQSESR